MSRRKITQQQHRRIVQHQMKRVGASNAIEGQKAILVAHFGKAVAIETAQGEIIHGRLRQHLKAVVGDEVIYQRAHENEVVIVAVLPRKTVIERPARNGMKAIAANVTQLVIVSAIVPALQPLLIDSFLMGAYYLHLQPLIVFNKIDLLDATQHSEVLEIIALYQALHYPVITTSTVSGEGLTELSEKLTNQTSILVGPSGVGKSSLIFNLIPNLEIQVQQLSEHTLHGQHTTTTARLYRLPSSGGVIDSPGVREFTLWPMRLKEIEAAYPEIQQHAKQCRFNNCRHDSEPSCAVKDAVSHRQIHPLRHQHFLKLVEELEKQDF